MRITFRRMLTVFFILLLFATCGCSKDEHKAEAKEKPKAQMIDLSEMSKTALYAELSNIMLRPEEHSGSRIKIRGKFSSAKIGEEVYKTCIVSDDAGCCSIGIEFDCEGAFEEGQDITVEGVLKTYYTEKDDLTKQCILQNATVY